MITFYFYKKGIGGVQNLYLNLIKELSGRGIKVKLIYFKDTWLTTELDRYNIDYDLFDLENDKKESLDSFIFPEDILIDTGFGGYLFDFYKINPYFIFWNVFPSALGSKAKNIYRKLLLKRIIINMLRKHGLVFMDDSGVKNIKEVYKIKDNIHYLPVPVEVSSEFVSTPGDLNLKRSKKFIPLCYLGRAELWKVVPVKSLLSNLESIAVKINKGFSFHIITDSKEDFARLIDYSTSDLITIEYHTDLFGEKLKKFLSDEILINFAMGTSCLESAAVGVPSIILDFNSFTTSAAMTNFKYRWLFETVNYNLGNLVEEDKPMEGHELQEIFDSLMSSDNYMKDIAGKCFSYVKQNHDLKIVTTSFLAEVNLCKNKLNPCLKYSYLHLKYSPVLNHLNRFIFFIFRYKLFNI